MPALDSLIQRFEAEHSGIRIAAQYVPTGDALIQKLVTAIHSNTAPDISWIHADFLDKLVMADAIYRMDHFLGGPHGLTQEELNDIFLPLLEAAKWRGTLYALPMEATTLALLYNRDLFRQAGLDPDQPPQNWDELYEYAIQLTLDKNNDGKLEQYGFYVPVFPASGPLSIWMVLQWSPFLWQAGGIEINLQQTEVLYNDSAGVAALSLWKRMYQEMQFENFSQAHDLGFASGTLAMVMDGPWNLPRYRQLSDLDWAVAPLPAGPAGRATYLAGEHLAIFKQSRHPDAAWTFVKWVLKPEIQAMFSMQSGYLPVRRSVLDREDYREFLATHPGLSGFVAQLPFGRARPRMDVYRIEINQHIAEAVERAIRGDVDPRSALNDAAARSNRLLETAEW
jgi:multiple sugar transport system substrate-binding protein